MPSEASLKKAEKYLDDNFWSTYSKAGLESLAQLLDEYAELIKERIHLIEQCEYIAQHDKNWLKKAKELTS